MAASRRDWRARGWPGLLGLSLRGRPRASIGGGVSPLGPCRRAPGTAYARRRTTTGTREQMTEPDWVRHAIWWHVYPLGAVGAVPGRAAAVPTSTACVAWSRGSTTWSRSAPPGILLGPVFASDDARLRHRRPPAHRPAARRRRGLRRPRRGGARPRAEGAARRGLQPRRPGLARSRAGRSTRSRAGPTTRSGCCATRRRRGSSASRGTARWSRSTTRTRRSSTTWSA